MKPLFGGNNERKNNHSPNVDWTKNNSNIHTDCVVVKCKLNVWW